MANGKSRDADQTLPSRACGQFLRDLDDFARARDLGSPEVVELGDLAKVAAMVVLGAFGFWQRGYLVKRMAGAATQKMFWWFIALELIIMGVAAGLAAGLARTPTPVSETLNQNPTPAEILTGSPLPPEFTLDRYFTVWNFDLIWLLFCSFAVFCKLRVLLRPFKVF